MNENAMRQDGLYFLANTLFNAGYIESELPGYAAFAEDISEIFEQFKRLYDPGKFRNISEGALEKEFIGPALELLGWETLYQTSHTVQGKMHTPDWSLFVSTENKSLSIQYADPSKVTVLCESKVYGLSLDTGKVDYKNNPHFQIISYLNSLKVRYGFLTNGGVWRLYDSEKTARGKTYYEIDLESILRNEDPQAFRYFYHIFKQAAYHQTDAVVPPPIEELSWQAEHFSQKIEENLKAVIYGIEGENSLFEAFGKALYARNRGASMEQLFENSMFLLFRLLFIVYFEDTNRAELDQHPHYRDYALNRLYDSLKKEDPTGYKGWFRLKCLFRILNIGAEDICIPLLNGGLFDNSCCRLLEGIKVFNNSELLHILEKLLFMTGDDGLIAVRRDYQSISVTHLGRIYEGLLDFRFEVAEEDVFYLEYQVNSGKTKHIEGYFDMYDYAKIAAKNKSVKAYPVQKGALYLKSSSNSRKSSASYYTPSSISGFLVKEALDRALSSGKQIADLKILDNACGSGHFLVESLNYLCALALERYEEYPELQQLVADEKEKIALSLDSLGVPVKLDEARILKRSLLKKCIFGVDLNPFAVELTRLSLWIDTFIFGTPLSFIEHHIKCGNALVGSSKKDFETYWKEKATLFQADFSKEFDDLKEVMQELDSLQDATVEEVAHSKQLYTESIAPRLEKLNRALNLMTYLAFKEVGKDKQAINAIENDTGLVEKIFAPGSDSAVIRQIDYYANEYRFFNYEVEFAEARDGFDCIVGNPPWDKTKFSDTDFFPQYRSNYRTMSNSEKEECRTDLLDKPAIREQYEREARHAALINDYYKRAYPLNRGAGDGNLFRFFVEKNLSLLAEGATLNYCLPSALMFEDGSTALRKHIFDNCRLNFFYSFENRNGLFPEVDSRYKFALMQLERPFPLQEGELRVENPVTNALFYLLDPTEINTTAIPYDLETVKTLSPNYWAFMEMRSPDDPAILKKCYAAFPPLSDEWLDFRNELHMTADKELFIEQQRDGLWPLFEGKMVWQFNPAFEEPRLFLDPVVFDAYLQDTEVRRMVADIYPTLETEETPQIKAVLDTLNLPYDPKCNDTNLRQLHHFVKPDHDFLRLAFRSIARDTDERTLIFCLLPKKCGVGNSLNSSVPKCYIQESMKIEIKTSSVQRLLFAMSIFNSLIIDYVSRFMIQINANKTYLMRLPIPQPVDAEIAANTDYARLALNALKLTLANDFTRFADLAQEYNISEADARLTPKQYDALLLENDRIVAKLYGILTEELAHIAKSFKVLKNKKPHYVAELLREA
jgi:hypothetical protein